MKALLSKQKVINKVWLIPTADILPNPNQPRKAFDPEKMDQLAVSIAQYGLLQPVSLVQTADGGYQLVAGERRLLACKMLKMDTIPAIITEMNAEKSSALALIENIQRCDLNFFEEASAIQKLMKMMGETQQAIAKRLGKNQSTVANKLRLLQFSPQVAQAILSANLTERHARALLCLGSQEDSLLLAAIEVIVQKEYNVAQTEQYLEQLLNKEKKPKPTRIFVVKDLKIFTRSIDKAIATMKLSGIEANSSFVEEEDCLVYTVRIPKECAYRQGDLPKMQNKTNLQKTDV